MSVVRSSSQPVTCSGCFTTIVFIVHLFLKILCAVDFHTYRGLEGYPTLAIVVTVLYALSIISPWSVQKGYFIEVILQGMGDRVPFHILHKSVAFWAFLLHVIIFLIPFALLLYLRIVLPISMLINVVILILNTALLRSCLTSSADLSALDETRGLYVLKELKEEVGRTDDHLKVLESFALCITLLNEGSQPITGNICIHRRVDEEIAILKFNLKTPIYPRKSFKLFPKDLADTEPVQGSGPHSFGTVGGLLVETKVFLGGSNVPSMIRTETYWRQPEKVPKNAITATTKPGRSGIV